MSDLPVIVAARRSPIAPQRRGLRSLTIDQLAAPVIRATLRDGSAALGGPRPIGDVVLGNCMGPGGNPARVAALAAGLDVTVPGLTVDRQCGSGLAAVIEAAIAIRAGDDRPRVAGGVESASTAPVRSVDGVGYARAPFTPAGMHDPEMTRAAEDLAMAVGISRERQDAYAARSHRLASAPDARAAFHAEIVPFSDLERDDGPGAVADRVFPRFPALFPKGTVTAANSSRVCDGAATVLIVPGRDRGAAPGLGLRSFATIGCDPGLPGLGAAPAIARALDRADLAMADVAAIEIVEAFAVQTLAVLAELGLRDLDPRVCADGGALALGHPRGASAAVSVVRL